MEKKKILILLLTYDKKNQNLYFDLVEEFVKKGHYVTVITINERKNKMRTYAEQNGNLRVLYVKTGNMFGVNFIEKGISTFTLGFLFKRAIKNYFSSEKFDLVVSPTPPISFTEVIKYLKDNFNTKSYLILRDIFPQNAMDLGIIKNKILFNIFRKKEKKLYKISDYIGCMSQGNINFLIQHNPKVNKEKLHILRNWGKPLNRELIDKDIIRAKYGFDAKDFLIIFGGNMGKPQGLEFLLKLANRTLEYKDVKFVLVGKGNEKAKLEEIKRKKNLNNVFFIDYIPRDEYEDFVSACDLGVVSLHSCFTIPNIPSKTVDYCKLGLPILAAIDKNTDYGKILEEEIKAGKASIYGEIEEYLENFENLYKNKEKLKEYSKNGVKYYSEYLTSETAYKTIMHKVYKGDEYV